MDRLTLLLEYLGTALDLQLLTALAASKDAPVDKDISLFTGAI